MAGGFGTGRFGAGRFGATAGPPQDPGTGGLVVTADLVGDPERSPQMVRVRVTGLTVGKEFHVRGQRAGSDRPAEWEVWGSGALAASSVETLGDIQGPLNAPITYTVTARDHADRWITATSAPVTVTHVDPWAIHSTAGTDVVRFWWLNNGDPREQGVRSALFAVPGREHPVARVDGATGDTGSMVLHTIEPHTSTLVDLVRDGAPVLLRTDGDVWDLPMTDVVLITRAQRVLSNGYRDGQNAREWRIDWASVDPPDPSTRMAVSTMAEFDAVWTGRTLAEFDQAWRTATMADFDNFDWGREAAG